MLPFAFTFALASTVAFTPFQSPFEAKKVEEENSSHEDEKKKHRNLKYRRFLSNQMKKIGMIYFR